MTECVWCEFSIKVKVISSITMKLIGKIFDKGMQGWVEKCKATLKINRIENAFDINNMGFWLSALSLLCRTSRRICGMHTTWLAKMIMFARRPYVKCKMKQRPDRRAAVGYGPHWRFVLKPLTLTRKPVNYGSRGETLRKINTLKWVERHFGIFECPFK